MSEHYSADLKGVVLACPSCGQKNRVPYERLGAQGTCGKCEATLPRIAAPVTVPSTAAFSALIGASALPVLVDFWAAWCGPCRALAPQLELVAKQEAGLTLIAKVNTEELPALAARFQIQGIPALLLFKGGNLVAQEAGAMSATALRELLHSKKGENA